jgi:hypothetical protein
MTIEELQRRAETSLGAARLDEQRGRGNKRVICLLVELTEELKGLRRDEVILDLMVALEGIGWRL